jgi:hypothetical protein
VGSGYDTFGGRSEEREREAVALGAQTLDRLLPGWEEVVNLESLHMCSGSLCMLGQTFGQDTEKLLATVMYPEEFKQAKDKLDKRYNGYEYNGYILGVTLVNILRDNKDITNHELSALRDVCEGHDNKCFWADEIAERLAAKETATNGQDQNAS